MFTTIKKHSANTQAVTNAQTMLNAAGFPVTVDGDFGAKTEAVVIAFQQANNLVADGKIGSKTWRVLSLQAGHVIKNMTARFLSEQDLVNAAQQLTIEVAAIKAVNEVESRGRGFLNDHPVILFERHVFWKRLQAYGVDPHEHQAGNENILQSRFGGYLGGVREVGRLEQAKAIHPQAAMESASWGLFQIMGYHWKGLNYTGIEDFVKRMNTNEAAQLDAFVRFMKANHLHRKLQRAAGQDALTLDNFTQFARRYNGPAFERNRYHSKMLAAYKKYRRMQQTAQVELPQAA